MDINEEIELYEKGYEIIKHFHNRTARKLLSKIESHLNFDEGEEFPDEATKTACRQSFQEAKNWAMQEIKKEITG